MPRPLWITGAIVVGALLGACGEAAPRREPAAGPPSSVSVLLVGDSIMEELADALTTAVEDNGVDRATFALGPALPRSEGDVTVWRRLLDRTAPDVVVLHIGSWERLEVLGEFATGARVVPGTYRSEVVDPAIDLLREGGATLLWVSPVPVRDRDEAAFIASLAREWQAALRGVDGAAYADVTPAIAPHGFAVTHPGPDGRQHRVRRSDGVHLCPAGQARVAAAIAPRLAPFLSEPPSPGWVTRWRRTVQEPGGCAPYD